MPVPSYRVPVRVARGTLAALTAGLTDLQEGELCYATDENILYVIEGGVLTPTVADLINDTTPQLGGNLDTNSFQIISTAAGNIQIAPDTTGVLEVMGNTGNDAVIKLNCETNTHGIKLKSPPHSAAADYTLVFPNDTGSNGQALTTDGAGVMSWTTPSTVGSINDLTDVDTATAAPTDGQALVWDDANTEWVPGTVAADLGTTSIDALQDVDTTTVAPTTDQVLAWDGTNWVPADQSGGGGGGGVGGSDLADLDDVETLTPETGEVLYNDAGIYRHAFISELVAGREAVTGTVSSTITADTNMAGINGLYTDNAALIADGFTHVPAGDNLDDGAKDIADIGDWGEYSTVDYLGQGFTSLPVIRINSNGTVYLHTSSKAITRNTGNYANDHSEVALCVAWLSQDTEVRRMGWKKITQDGTDWFVVRVDMKVPYNNDTGGYPLETWFGKDGRIRQYWGDKVGSGASITVGNTRQGVATYGTNLTDVELPFEAGGNRVDYEAAGALVAFAGTKLEDLSDVGTPADGEILVWVDANNRWEPVDYISKTTLQTETAAATDFADFQARIAAL